MFLYMMNLIFHNCTQVIFAKNYADSKMKQITLGKGLKSDS